jgi:hypothetical protein
VESSTVSENNALKSKEPEELEPSQEYLANEGKIMQISRQLQMFDPKQGDFTPVYNLAKDLLEPEYFMLRYIEEHPRTKRGPEVLNVIAATNDLITALIGGHKKQTAEAYYLLIDLYPNHESVPKAKRWLRLHHFETD